jgi:hypothetical protein
MRTAPHIVFFFAIEIFGEKSVYSISFISTPNFIQKLPLRNSQLCRTSTQRVVHEQGMWQHFSFEWHSWSPWHLISVLDGKHTRRRQRYPNGVRSGGCGQTPNQKQNRTKHRFNNSSLPLCTSAARRETIQIMATTARPRREDECILSICKERIKCLAFILIGYIRIRTWETITDGSSHQSKVRRKCILISITPTKILFVHDRRVWTSPEVCPYSELYSDRFTQQVWGITDVLQVAQWTPDLWRIFWSIRRCQLHVLPSSKKRHLRRNRVLKMFIIATFILKSPDGII